MNPRLLYILFTYNRPAMLKECLRTLFNPQNPSPDRVLILDDGSQPNVKAALFEAQVKNQSFPIDIYSFGRNIGYGTAAEFAIRAVETYDPQYAFFIESDYIFTPNGLSIVMDLFENNRFAKEAVAFSGYDNPDFYKPESTNVTFPQIIKNDCGEDNLNREILYKPFEQETRFGKINLEFVSNSCGTMYFNWQLVKAIRQAFPSEYQMWVDKVTDKHKTKRNLNDGMMSHGISWLWTKLAQKNGLDITQFAALLNIKPSVADHINGGGINGYIAPEGASFVSSPSFKHL